MKKRQFSFPFLILPGFILLFSCNGNPVVNKPVSDSADSSKAVSVNIPKSNRDSIGIDLEQSTFDCTRSKMVKDVDQDVVIFGKTMSVKMDKASFSASVAIKMLRANWFYVDQKFTDGKVVLDMNSVSTIQVGKSKELEMGSPNYLDVKKYPTATLTILRFDSIPGNQKELNVVAKLQLKDSIADLEFPAKMEFENNGEKMIPTKLSGDFHIDGIKWGLNRKNAKVLKDDLMFHVILVTGKH
jgi:hypothetical protein